MLTGSLSQLAQYPFLSFIRSRSELGIKSGVLLTGEGAKKWGEKPILE